MGQEGRSREETRASCVTNDDYFAFVSRILVKQIDILGDWLVYDEETNTYSFPANQWDVLQYEKRDFEKVLETHLSVYDAYKNVYDSLYGDDA